MRLTLFPILSLLTLVLGQKENINLDAANEGGFQGYGNAVATVQILDSSNFVSSWNAPLTVQYSNPGVSFNRVILDLKVNTTGNNYDRLIQIFVSGSEVWRSSTSEPSDDNSFWDYQKDVTQYLPLFQKSGQVSVLLNNEVQGSLNGQFQVTLTARFFQTNINPGDDDFWALQASGPPTNVQNLPPASGNYWSYPGTDVKGTFNALDSKVKRAVVHVFASGSSDEEFWWTKQSSSSDKSGPSRFVEVYIGNTLAGFATPFPVIYTGGLSPYLWKPIAGLRAYDVPAYYIDITPFLPALWGGSWTMSLKVTNGIDDSAVQSYWILNANVLTWEGSQSNSGSNTQQNFDPNSSGPVPVGLPQNVQVQRTLSTSADLVLDGQSQHVTWSQNVTFQNYQSVDSNSVTNVYQNSVGTDSFSGAYADQRQFQYPLTVAMSNNYYHVQQTYNGNSKAGVQSWDDSSLNLNSDGSVASAQSKQWLSDSSGVQNAGSQNNQLLYS